MKLSIVGRNYLQYVIIRSWNKSSSVASMAVKGYSWLNGVYFLDTFFKDFIEYKMINWCDKVNTALIEKIKI